MRKIQKKMILELIETFNDAHRSAKELAENNKLENAKLLLVDCQKTAVQIVDIIENSETAECPAVSLFREYCAAVYNTFQEISSGKTDIDTDGLNAKLAAAKSSVEKIKIKLEIAFFPYKSSMWDSLESIWKAADADPDCEAYVVPIPYFDRNPDHSFGKLHYEGNEYPDYVPVIDYRKYDHQARRPDIVYIHNPYDDYNYVTSVHPNYYSRELKKYTDMLVYVPYYVIEEVTDSSAEFICSPPVIKNSDRVILQYKQICTSCIDFVRRNNIFKENPNKKFVPLGSPKIDAAVNLKREDFNICDEWKDIIKDRKVVFYNTSIGTFLQYSDSFFDKLKNDIEFFKNSDEWVLWWRPHPLLKATMSSMRPFLIKEYEKIAADYINEKSGIYDESSDLYRALAWGDIYYGTKKSSVHKIYSATRKPFVLIQFDLTGNPDISFEDDYKNNYDENKNPYVLGISENSDGTCGKKVHKHIKNEVYNGK